MKTFTIFSLFFSLFICEVHASPTPLRAEVWARYVSEGGDIQKPKTGMVLLLRGELAKRLSKEFRNDPEKRYRCKSDWEADGTETCEINICPDGTVNWDWPHNPCPLSNALSLASEETYIDHAHYLLSDTALTLDLRGRLASRLSAFWQLIPPLGGEYFRATPTGYCEQKEFGPRDRLRTICQMRIAL